MKTAFIFSVIKTASDQEKWSSQETHIVIMMRSKVGIFKADRKIRFAANIFVGFQSF